MLNLCVVFGHEFDTSQIGMCYHACRAKVDDATFLDLEPTTPHNC